ncbi:zinc finger X-chromosomal protein-like isoform X2 [Harmonia axyridis]|uniref:zinc finger X-chromosomal protein-like isoform X2 n=1 Tax=Harmonia axyridis TaxID=115357 RepID=UPI001E279D04|nr:zinc finger X-chromosomal protein-like isoform X2 [Harmonia axyridis]XP_045462544.1 zinc finger X-chromosomal protein-like isoform X2 [Harmonia axyridis]
MSVSKKGSFNAQNVTTRPNRNHLWNRICQLLTRIQIITKHICNLCGGKYKNRASLSLHLNYECSKKRKLQSSKCDYKTKTKINLQQPLSHNQSDSVIHKCHACNRIFCFKRNLRHHIKNECGHTCKLCGRGYKHRASLLRHLKYECFQEGKFHCPKCDYKAKRKHSLDSHLSTANLYSDCSDNYQCSACNRTYCFKWNLTHHLNYECGKYLKM